MQNLNCVLARVLLKYSVNRAIRKRTEQATALWLRWTLGDRRAELAVWRDVVGKSRAAYDRRLTEALLIEAELVAEYPFGWLPGGRDWRAVEKGERMEERRRLAWEKVRRLNNQSV